MNKHRAFQWQTELDHMIAAVFSACISCGAEQTGTYGGEVDGKIAGRHFEHLLCETT